MTQKSNEVAVVGNATVPDYLKNYQGPTGAEGIEAQHVSVPRIKLMQGLSEDVKNQIAKDGDLVLNITGTVLAEADQPLLFTPLATGMEYILWRDRKDNNGGIMNRARRVVVDGKVRYKWDQTNTTFETRLDGKKPVKWACKTYIDEDGLDRPGSQDPSDPANTLPAATAHHNYVVALPDFGDLVAAISLSRTGAKRARDLNGILKMDGKTPIHARVIRAKSVDEKNQAGQYKNWNFRPAGFVPQDTYKRYDEIVKALSESGYTVDQTDAQTNDDDHGGAAVE